MEHHVWSDQRSRRLYAIKAAPSRKDSVGKKLIKGVILSVAFVAQLERNGIAAVIKEPSLQPQKCERWNVAQLRPPYALGLQNAFFSYPFSPQVLSSQSIMAGNICIQWR